MKAMNTNLNNLILTFPAGMLGKLRKVTSSNALIVEKVLRHMIPDYCTKELEFRKEVAR